MCFMETVGLGFAETIRPFGGGTINMQLTVSLYQQGHPKAPPATQNASQKSSGGGLGDKV